MHGLAGAAFPPLSFFSVGMGALMREVQSNSQSGSNPVLRFLYRLYTWPAYPVKLVLGFIFTAIVTAIRTIWRLTVGRIIQSSKEKGGLFRAVATSYELGLATLFYAAVYTQWETITGWWRQLGLIGG
ncbi:hypothetical protein [Parvularcula marina]|nr:hypothetical protein [Parvularcula marina]